MIQHKPSTGLSGLDQVLKGLMPGDNVVWQIESVKDYREFAKPYCTRANTAKQKVVYFRFAKHEPLFTAGDDLQVCELNPQEGFESFISEIHRTIQHNGQRSCYVFDCLSDLAADWYSDQMLANFFMLTSPYILQIKALAYFALFRNSHSSQATGPIAETTQIFLDVYRHDGSLYIRPQKVEWRYSPTMFMLHVLENEQFLPVTESARTAEVMAPVPWMKFEAVSQRLDVWSRTLREAEEAMETVERGEARAEDYAGLFRRLLRMIVSRDPRVLNLTEMHLGIRKVLEIGRRMVGTGLIGGKSVGMLLARAILRKSCPRWNEIEEIHDSFFAGSDVFYTYLVRNGCWWVREKQKNPDTFLDGAGEARERILNGTFPDYLIKSFSNMLDYFGQSPIIVRSSSLLEDNFGNAFSGKYESVFCPNQGPSEERLKKFIAAVQTVYASSMSEEALTYREKRGILGHDEQMALLVQRVSGSLRGNLFYPDIAGVGYSFNPYVWNRDIDPEAGMLRLVFGLGTRAVNRNDDEYTRIVSLNAPDRRPEASFDQVRRYAQHRADVLDLEKNELVSMDFSEAAQNSPDLPLGMIAMHDSELEKMARERGIRAIFPWVLTFEGLFTRTTFIEDMRSLMTELQKAYDYPVDIEFTANLIGDGQFHVNLLQCRPFPVKGSAPRVDPPTGIVREQLVLHTRGPVIGHSRMVHIDRIIYVVPSAYGQLARSDQYSIARLIGKLSHLKSGNKPLNLMLMGPGRWGTTTPSLGVPVSFAEINTVSVLCEIVAMRDNLVPDVSLGTHFFNDLVEMDMLYVGIFPEHEESMINRDILEGAPNRLAEMMPSATASANVVRVINASDCTPGGTLTLYANAVTQRVVCCVET
ncbi:MAG: pyruvate, phosphate dikinase [Candidatus Sumerlaeota bacterium]|nr:pyruvate, phosphate dikinase [Candidatus Sumerlaeota bacterium]